MVQCVTHVISSQYLGFVGNVLNVEIMTFVQFATMEINIISVIVFIVLPHLVVKGKVLLYANDDCLVGFYTKQSYRLMLTFWRHVPPPFSGRQDNILMDTEVIKRKKYITYVDRSASVVASQNHDLIGSYYGDLDVSSDPL